MKRVILFSALLLFAVTGFAGPKVKQLVCHVGNETGPEGETYFDDPAYDAGKIDLIVVANAQKHLDNPNHFWDGFYDYDPIAEGASGEGTEDSDGNGIDDGCEIPDVCPCWDEIELQSVTADNVYEAGCSFFSAYYPYTALLIALATQPGTDNFFYATDGSPSPGTPPRYSCSSGDGIEPEERLDINEAELLVCTSQIATRCAAIGDPIIPD